MQPGVDVTVGIPTRNRSRLLARSIASVLGQSHRRFALVVSDNASDDDTAGVVASFRDPRLTYRPLQRNIDRHANFNRLIELAETEFVVLLSDDDELHPDHLSLTVDTLNRFPTVGVAHTGCVIADALGNTLVPHARPFKTERSIEFESGARFIERSMKSMGTVCFSSATFRRAALVSGRGLRPEDGAVDDFALLMRIATEWDFAYLNRALSFVMGHAEAESSAIGSFAPDGSGFRWARSLPGMLYERRLRFLAEADLPEVETGRLARIAEKTYRRDRVRYLSMRATTGDRSPIVFRALGKEMRRDPHLGLDPITWRFIVGQLGGRRSATAYAECSRQRGPGTLRGVAVGEAERKRVPKRPTDVAPHEIERALKRGALWALGSQVAVQAIRFAGVVALARLLTPSDYGAAALAITIGSYSMIIGDLGYGTALVQAPSASQRRASTAYWCALGAGMIGSGIVVLGAYPAARLLGESEVTGLVIAGGLTLFLVAAASTSNALLTRSMSFGVIQGAGMIAALIATACAVAAAALGAGAWALVLQQVVLAAVTSACFIVAARWHPSLEFSRAAMRSLTRLRFSTPPGRLYISPGSGHRAARRIPPRA